MTSQEVTYHRVVDIQDPTSGAFITVMLSCWAIPTKT